MKNYCKIYLSGSTKAPYDWVTSVPPGINRLCIINEGIGGYIVNNVQIPFKKGCIYLFPALANDIRTYSSYKTDSERLDHSYANFEIVPPILTNKVICIDPTEKPELKPLIDVLHYLFIKSAKLNSFHNLSEADQRYMKQTIIYLINIIINEEKCEQINDVTIIKALSLMHENLSQKLSVEDIANKFELSSEGFIRKFKRHMGVTPYAYLKKLRIRTALNMRFEGYSLNEIAEKCGYADSSSLLHAISNEK